MKLSTITNLELIKLIENATELFRNDIYYSKEYVEKHIGLGIHRSGFIGHKINDDINALSKGEIIFNETGDIKLIIEGFVNLPTIPINTSGTVSYTGYGLLEVNGVVIYDGRANVSGTATWGNITGNISDQADLQLALNDKLSLSGGTMSGDIDMDGNNLVSVGSISATGNISTIANLVLSSYTPNTILTVGTGGLIENSSVTTTELGYLSGVTSNIQAQLDNKVIAVSGTANRISITGTATNPVIDIASNYIGQTSITIVGAVGTGTWEASIISPIYGGTGVNNGAKTITLGGNLITAGAFALTLTLTAATNVTLPTTGTLSTLAGIETLSNKTLTSPVINVGSDATGDLYYRNSGGNFTRLPIGATNNLLTVASGLPAWSTASTIINSAYSFTNGSVMFWNSGFAQNNNNFYWNNSLSLPSIGALSIATNGDFGGTDAINFYYMADSYLPNSLNTAGSSSSAGYSVSSSRGTGVSPTESANLDYLGSFSGWGHNGSTFELMTDIRSIVSGVTVGNKGSRIDLYAKYDGGSLIKCVEITPIAGGGVNYVKLQGGTTPIIAVAGSTNANLQIMAAGTGFIQLTGGTQGTVVSTKITIGVSTNMTYRTTNGGSNISPEFIINPANPVTAGNISAHFDATNGLAFSAGNGSNRIARAFIHVINLANTAAAEAGDLGFYTQTGGSVAVLRATLSHTGLSITGSTAGTSVLSYTTTNTTAQGQTIQNRVTTTTAAVTTLQTFATVTNSVHIYRCVVTAERTGGTSGTAGDSGGWSITGYFKNIAGIVTLLGVDPATGFPDQGSWAVAFTISGTNVLLQVIPSANNNITWNVTAQVFTGGV